jgi:formate-dependent phosphoribosylglycinamide formyltransferase (GAR transformylase)
MGVALALADTIDQAVEKAKSAASRISVSFDD